MDAIIPCVQCGYCCTVSPCGFGKWDEEKKQCKYLTKNTKCKKYYKIIALVGMKASPGFGGGCSSSLFNTVRENKIKELQNVNKKNNTSKKKK